MIMMEDDNDNNDNMRTAAMEVGGSIIKKYEGDSAKLETFIDARWHRELKATRVNRWGRLRPCDGD